MTIVKFTLIIPTYNEAPVIAATLATLVEGFQLFYDIDWSIIVVDNASTDNTGDIVENFGDKHVKLIRIATKGKGNAIRSAFSKTEGDIVGFTDADLPISPEEIINATKLLVDGTLDVVVGSRLLPQSKMPAREWWRTWSSRVFNDLAQIIVGVQTSDTQCPLKLMNTKGLEVMLATKEPTWFFDLEFLALVERLKLRLKEVPIMWNEHRYPLRKSKLTAVDSVRAVVAMFRIRKHLSTQISLLEQRMVK